MSLLTYLYTVLLGLLSSVLLCWLPAFPLFNIVAGCTSGYYLERQRQSQQKNISKISISILLITNGLLSGLIYCLVLYLTLDLTTNNQWLRIKYIENLIYNSPDFKLQFFLFSSLLCAITYGLGLGLLLRYKLAKPIESDTELMSQLSIRELQSFYNNEEDSTQ